jgi:hypothetical protein
MAEENEKNRDEKEKVYDYTDSEEMKEEREDETNNEKTHEVETRDKKTNKNTSFSTLTYVLVIIAVGVIAFNQVQIMQISQATGGNGNYGGFGGGGGSGSLSGGDLTNIDLSSIGSTAQSIGLLFPLDSATTTQDAVNIMIPVGTPEYAGSTGLTYDDPVTSLALLKNMYYNIKDDIKQNDAQVWERYMNLASMPVGISCEYCCGVGPIGIRSNGELNCGCAHAPALHGLTLFLMKYTDYNDAEILKEVLKWKALFFPRNMIEIAMEVAGMDSTQLSQLPGMVGGC